MRRPDSDVFGASATFVNMSGGVHLSHLASPEDDAMIATPGQA
jgi:hypothetical protein